MCFVISATAAMVMQTGCMLASNLMHVAGMDMIPAEYEGLEDQNVAIIVLTPSAQHDSDPAVVELTSQMRQQLLNSVKDVTLVRNDRIRDWWDTHGYDSTDYAALGTDVGATKVLVISLENLRLKDGATLFRGSADCEIEVFDVAKGAVVHSRRIDEYQYPKMAGQHTSETTEKRFRALYLRMMADEITRSYRKYDAHERYALDSKIASQ